jgi:hypothetical protein
LYPLIASGTIEVSFRLPLGMMEILLAVEMGED